MRDFKKRESFVDKYEKIVNLSINENEYIRSKYNWHLKLASAIIVVTIACTYWLISDHISGYTQILDSKFSEILSTTEFTQDSLNRLFVDETNESIKNLITKNFSEEEILKTIKVVATEKVDSVSEQYLDKLVEQKIKPKLNSVITGLGSADTKIQLFDFYLAKVSAYNDDRISFDKLIEISNSKTNKYHVEAGQIVNSLISKYSQNVIPSKHPIIRSTEKDEGFTWSINDCKNWFFNYPKEGRITILENVFEIKRFNDTEKIEMALLAIKKDESLAVVREATTFLIKKFNLDYKNLEIKNIINSMAKKGFK